MFGCICMYKYVYSLVYIYMSLDMDRYVHDYKYVRLRVFYCVLDTGEHIRACECTRE
jgi:hypothetical protein